MPSAFVPPLPHTAYDPERPGMDETGTMALEDVARLEGYLTQRWVTSPSWAFLGLPDPSRHRKFWFKFDEKHAPRLLVLRCHGAVVCARDVVPLKRYFSRVMRRYKRRLPLVVDLNGFDSIQHGEAVRDLVEFLRARAPGWFSKVAVLRTKHKDNGVVFNKMVAFSLLSIDFASSEAPRVPVRVFERSRDVDAFLAD